MTSTTGNRCAIYDKIDALERAPTVAALVAQLRPILNELAYYAVTGEAAVNETHEEWHTTFTDRLYEAMGSDRSAAIARAGAPGAMPAPSSTVLARAAELDRARGQAGRRPQAKPAAGGGRTEGGFGDSADRLPPAPPGNRPRPGGPIPSSLLAIMNGSHPSLREDDYAPGF